MVDFLQQCLEVATGGGLTSFFNQEYKNQVLVGFKLVLMLTWRLILMLILIL